MPGAETPHRGAGAAKVRATSRLALRWRSPRISRAAWLNGEVLLLLGRLAGAHPGDATADVLVGEQAIEVESHCLAYEHRRRGEIADRRSQTLVILRLPPGGLPQHWSRIELRSASGRLLIDPESFESALTDLRSLLEELANLEPERRKEVRRFLLSVLAPELERPGGFSLSKSLYLVREALREPLPEQSGEKDKPQAVQVDTLVAVDETGFWISGWTRDEDGTFNRLTVVSPEGQEADLDDAFRLRRPDVEKEYGGSGRQAQKHGFAKFFELPAPSPLETGWIVELRDPAGAGIQVEAPAAIRDAEAARDLLVAQFTEDRANREELRVKHVHPAIMRLQEQHRKSVEIDSVVDYGAAIASPAVSIVVTLYRRIDFLQHQLLHFAQDRTIREAELIYVLDSPELADSLSELASALYAFHRAPFRIVRLTRNAGFPIANNIGASLARGRLLLLLNSDVVPDRPGWLEKMASFYEATPEIGVLGPKLLFEDDSIQHAGMYFEREAASRLWGNLHYFKGLHRSFPPANVARPVPAVTGACLMISRALYAELGGLSPDYIQIGYEDSDLCLRLIAQGRSNWYLGEVELYHLEGQAFPTRSREAFTKYNIWLQTHLWDTLIEQVMQDEAVTAAAVASETQEPQIS